jgi:hypothetical protein
MSARASKASALAPDLFDALVSLTVEAVVLDVREALSTARRTDGGAGER